MVDYGKSKPKESFTTSVKDAINLLTIDRKKKDIHVFGSYNYKESPYPGDIDLIEILTLNGTIDNILTYLVKNIQRVVRDISKIELTYLTDVKAGLDYRYILQSLVGTGVIDRTNSKRIKEEIDSLYSRKLLTKEEYDKATEIIYSKNDNGVFRYENMIKFLREHIILRWDKSELLKGYKILRGGLKKTLKESILDPTMVKIDIITLINGRFMEVTNILRIYQIKDGRRYEVNDPHRDYIVGLQQELAKNLSEYYNNPFKSVKRMFSIARSTGDNEMMRKMIEILKSNIGILYQVRSEISNLILLLEKVKNPPMEKIMKQVEEFKSRLSYINNIIYKGKDGITKKRITESTFYDIIDNIVNNYKKMSKEDIIEILEDLKNDLTALISVNTYDWLTRLNLLPPPNGYMPNRRDEVLRSKENTMRHATRRK